MFNLAEYVEERQRLINEELTLRMPGGEVRPGPLHEAMRYSVLAGGKRFRPILCLAAAEAAGDHHGAALIPAALAVEVLHTYTLIHDDLPCMDNDDIRRGQPSLHKVHGEAMALLAGDALLTLAFEWLAAVEAPGPYAPNRLSQELAVAAGSRGVIGGQVEDIAVTDGPATADQINYVHTHKTGALIRAAVRMGAIAAGADEGALSALTEYAEAAGLAFQIADDILDETSSTAKLGKPVGSDAAMGRRTYVTLHGLDASKERANALVAQAVASIAELAGNIEPLCELAKYAAARPA